MAKTPVRPIRVSNELWDEFGAMADLAEPPADRSALLRDFMRWYCRHRGQKIPARPVAGQVRSIHASESTVSDAESP